MTENFYHRDAHLKDMEACVTNNPGGWEALDRAAFYPGGTHVGNTRQVGRIRVADIKSKARINKQLVIELED